MFALLCFCVATEFSANKDLYIYTLGGGGGQMSGEGANIYISRMEPGPGGVGEGQGSGRSLPIELLLDVGSILLCFVRRRRRRRPVASSSGCTLAPPGEYDGSILLPRRVPWRPHCALLSHAHHSPTVILRVSK